MKRNYVVRVCTDPQNPNDQRFLSNRLLFDALRGASLIQVHRENEEGMCFDVMPPANWPGGDTLEWAKIVATSLTALGLNAVYAPEWCDDEKKPEDKTPDDHHNLYTG